MSEATEEYFAQETEALIEVIRGKANRQGAASLTADQTRSVIHALQAAQQMVGGPPARRVKLTAIGDRKVQVIKVVRAVTDLGLKQAKVLVDDVAGGHPRVLPLLDGQSPDDAAADLREQGATAELAGLRGQSRRAPPRECSSPHSGRRDWCGRTPVP